ncbi:DNA repair protein RAD51 homolog 4 isoform X2 [Phyllostomus hastatus]|uniref:DNA repair protein RAD51 homolog 4 isoform X2 n=1 Tax=Phyllostomus hastatus TaxID=9423 RepID=UPI001E683081|nr:DNA repair protein RAD51 homolog 4 isoform X2 [Phyllostomus hastatus]
MRPGAWGLFPPQTTRRRRPRTRPSRPADGAAGPALRPGSRKRRPGATGGPWAPGTPRGAVPSARRPPIQKGAPRGVCRGRCGCPLDERPGAPGNMGVLRAGLCPGLTQDMVQLLRSHGIKTVVDLVSADLEEVAQKCGLSYKALVALRRVLLAQFSAFPFNGADLYEELKTSTAILSTGIGSLDKLLDAGLYTGEVTEIAGVPGSGKTQVCLCVAANVAHGLQQNVLYVDSNGGLTASRILQLLQARTADEGEQAGALQRIQVARAFDIFQVLDVLQDLRGAVAQQVRDSAGTVKVVIVDSVTAVVSPLLGGQQREGLALMMQLAQELKTLARDLGVAVLVTNHMTRDRDSGKLRPALGRSWSFVPSTRVVLASGEGAGAPGSQRTVCLTKSPRLPTGFQETVDFGTWGTLERSPE